MTVRCTYALEYGHSLVPLSLIILHRYAYPVFFMCTSAQGPYAYGQTSGITARGVSRSMVRDQIENLRT
jgi:hypothetical protein